MANLFNKAVGWVKANPGYAIGGAGGVGFIGYLVYKQQQSARQTASGASGTQATDATSQFAGGDLNATPSYDYLYGYYQGNPPDTTSSLDTQTGGSTGGSSGGSLGPPQFQGGPVLAPGPSGGVNSGNSSPIVAGAQSLRQIAMQYGETLQQLYDDNAWLGHIGGNYSTGKDYNPDLPGNVSGKTLIVRSGTGIGFGFIRSGWHRIINHQALWSTDLADSGVN